MPNVLVKLAAARPPIKASPAMTASAGVDRSTGQRHRAVKCAQIDEKLTDKAVERRQAGNRHCADEKSNSGPRHALKQTAKLRHLTRSCTMHHCPGTEEEQPLKEGVVHYMQQSTSEPQHSE